MARPLLMLVLMMKIGIAGLLGLLGITGVAGCAAETNEEGASRAAEASTCSVEDVAQSGSGVGTKDLRWNGAKFNGPTLNGVAFNGVNWNGPLIQGVRLNGLKLNGLSLNGINLNGISLNGIDLNGINLNGVELNGPVFQGTRLNGPVLNGPVLQGISLQGTRFVGLPAGTDLTGAELIGELTDGSTISLFVDEVRENPDAKNADVALYRIGVGDARESLCGQDAAGNPLFATAIANTWDERTGARIDGGDRFTFACQGGALYKCVDAGYKPWKSAELADYHQACTRMIRADYCGDGTSYTKDGTLIDMGDGIGVQTFATEAQADFAFEASWGPNGATCVSKTRYRLTSVPSCLADRLKDSCETPSSQTSGVRLANRSAAQTTCLR